MGGKRDPVERLRAICLALPGVSERLSHGGPTWFAGKRSFVSLADHHHGSSHLAAWCAAPPGAQEMLIDAAPGRFFRPPYVGHRGWIGLYLDTPDADWDEVALVVREAFRAVAPPKLVRLAEERQPETG